MSTSKTSFLLSLLSLLVVAMIASGCKKKVTSVNEDWVGLWEGHDGSTTYRLKVEEDSDGWYEEANGVTETTNGTVRIKGDLLKVGPFKKLNINQHPTKKTTPAGYVYWQIELEGVVMTK